MLSKKLDGKVAVITGAYRGIGKGIAQVFSKYGAKLTLVDFNEGVADTAEEIVKSGGEAIAVIANVGNVADCQSAVDKTIEQYGTVDILVTCVGIFDTNAFLTITEDRRDLVWDVNVNGVWNFARCVLPEMIRKKAGKITIISSVTGCMVANPERVAYATSKSALGGFTRALASELAQHRINVNSICPGLIRTPMLEELAHGRDEEDLERIMDELGANVPMGRLGRPEDVGELAAFLSSYESDYITGTQTVIDGGNLLPEH